MSIEEITINNQFGYIEASGEDTTYTIECLKARKPRQKNGTKLLQMFIEQAKENGADLIKLYAETEDEDIIDLDGLCEFYKKNGFIIGVKTSTYAYFEKKI